MYGVSQVSQDNVQFIIKIRLKLSREVAERHLTVLNRFSNS